MTQIQPPPFQDRAWEPPVKKTAWWKRRWGLPAWAALGAGTGIALLAASLGAAGQQPAQPKVETRTITKTVPGPTREITVPGPTREVVSQDCLDALQDAEHLLGSSRDGIAAGAEIIRLQNQALQLASQALSDPLSIDASATAQMEGLSSQVQDQTAKVEQLTADVQSSGAAYETAAAACRSAG